MTETKLKLTSNIPLKDITKSVMISLSDQLTCCTEPFSSGDTGIVAQLSTCLLGLLTEEPATIKSSLKQVPCVTYLPAELMDQIEYVDATWGSSNVDITISITGKNGDDTTLGTVCILETKDIDY